MAAAVTGNVVQGLVERVHYLQGHFVIHELRAVALLCGVFQVGILIFKGNVCSFVGIDDDVLLRQLPHQVGQIIQSSSVN